MSVTSIGALTGFIPATEPKMFRRFPKTAAIIYKGDLVQYDMTASGVLAAIVAPDAADTTVGVAMEYAAAADSYVTVCTDPNMTYYIRGMEADAATVEDYVVATMAGQWCRISVAGTEVNFQSAMILDIETETLSYPDGNARVQIIGLADLEGNSATGVLLETPILEVRFYDLGNSMVITS